MQQNQTMQEKEYLQDLLSTQKFVASNYNTYAGECRDQSLRGELLNILKEEHDIQNDLFQDMSQRGWYPVKPAEQKEIDAAVQKFSGS